MTTQRRFFNRPRLWGILCGLTLAVAQFFTGATLGTAQAATTTCTPSGLTQDCTVTFVYSGAAETWTVPAGVTQATFDLYGAQGADGLWEGGKGGRVTATLSVTPGANYQIRAGGWGSNGGFNGGTNGGGGASDVRSGAFGLTDRILVAGGGGRGAYVPGGDGGFPNGGAGTDLSDANGALATGGSGGTQTGGGAGGSGSLGSGGAGTLGQGGSDGGGGGYYGGGGGSINDVNLRSGGGGGSSFGPTAATFENGVRIGDGLVILTYSLPETTPPTANPTQSPAANASGWTDRDVTVFWNWTDNPGGTGIDQTHCTFSSPGNGEGVQTLTATCQDRAGNVGTASYTVKVDKTPPTANPVQSPAANASGWTTSQNVTVNWNWTDSGSGLDPANCTTSSNSGSELGSITFEVSCSDLANNLGVASYTLQIDPFAPRIFSTKNPGPNGASWNNSAVTVSFGCNDGNLSSGVASNTLAGATLSSEGANQSVTNTGSCVDVAGNVATPLTAGPINIDLTKPTISAAATTAPNANGWYNNNVTIRYTCADALSGVVSCPSDQGLSSEGTAVASLALFARDAADNVSDPSNVVTVKIDKTAPSVLVTGVSNGAIYNFGSVPTAACSTTDALSGVATQATLSITGGNGDGSGNFTAACSGATDLAGNSAAPVSVSYTVTAGGTLVGVCGGYEVRQTGSSYTAAGWSGAIKVGTNGNNTLNGGSGPDLMLGLGGNDKLDGKGGDDILCGGDGVDLIQGMAGNDYLDGGAGNDVLNGGSGDHDQLLAGDGNDTLLDGDGVSNAQGGAGNDLFTLALRKGWRDTNGQTQFVERLAAGYGNDTVILVILDRSPFFVDVTGDERDDPASPLEGNDDRLGLLGNLSPAPVRLKFEKQLVISAEAEGIVSEDAGAEYLTESVGEEAGTADLNNRLFLPLVNR